MSPCLRTRPRPVLFLLFLILVLLARVTARAQEPGGEPSPPPEKGASLLQVGDELATKLRAVPDPVKALGLLPQSLAEIAQRHAATGIAPLFAEERVGKARIEELKQLYPVRSKRGADPQPILMPLFKLSYADAADPEVVALELAADSNVVWAEPNRGDLTPTLTPNDPFFTSGSLWGLRKVNAEGAWDRSQGAGVVVAVVDTGVDKTHPDLAANLWTNPREIPGNGIDDDGNGFRDDVRGWDFKDDDNDPDDNPCYGHGTHVAGTIAAIGNNLTGVVGLAFKSTIMPVRGLHYSGTFMDLAEAILYAVDNGADVINDSWGGPGTSLLMDSVVRYAHDSGVVVVNAAGNTGTLDTCSFTPSNAEHGLSVAAYTALDTRAAYSSCGTKLDVAAPGGVSGGRGNPDEDILSTVPACSVFGVPDFRGPGGERYQAIAGTSMATPHVSGLAALLIAQHPGWTVEELRQAIRQGAADVGNPGIDIQSGHGRIDALASLSRTVAPLVAAIASPRNCSRVSGSTQVFGQASSRDVPFLYYVLMGGNTTRVTSCTVADSGQPASFIPLANGFTQFPNEAFLGSVDTRQLQDGEAVLQLVVTGRDASGVYHRSFERNVVNVDNVFLTRPGVCAILRDNVTEVHGQITGPSCGSVSWRLEWTADPATGWVLLNQGTTCVEPASRLATWDLSTVPNAKVTLRLTATFAGGYVTTDTRTVYVEHRTLPGWPVTVPSLDPLFTLKSPMIADLDPVTGNGRELIIGLTALRADGTVKPGWDRRDGLELGRSNPVVVDVNPPSLDTEVIGIVYEPAGALGLTPVVYAYRPDKSILWRRPLDAFTAIDHAVASSLSATDLDGDLRPEVVFTLWPQTAFGTWQSELFVLDGRTGVIEGEHTLAGRAVSTVSLADIDGDGAREMVVALAPDAVHVMRLDGSELPGWPQVRGWSSAMDEYAPVISDVDHDGCKEIQIGNRMFNHDGSDYGWYWPVGGGTNSGVIVPLADTDRELDVVQSYPDVYIVREHTGGNTGCYMGIRDANYIFDASPENGAPGGPIVADVNGDGLAEILMGSRWGRKLLDPCPMQLYVSNGPRGADLSGCNQYTPGFPVWMEGPGSLWSSAVVDDLDGDGYSDLAVAAAGRVHVWKLGVPLVRASNPWPVFGHDLAHSGEIKVTVPPRRDQVVYGSRRTGNGELFRAEQDGSGTVDLTNNPANDWNLHHGPAASPDGSLIAFVSNRDNVWGEIYVMPASGGPATRMTSNSLAEDQLSFSPDGRKLLFVQNWEVLILDLATRAVTNVSNSAAMDIDPSFSPDGGEVVFISTRTRVPGDGSPNNTEVFLAKADGTNLRRLTATPEVEFRPSFSPDGSMISFVSNRGTPWPYSGGPYNVYLMRPDGSSQTRVPGTTNSSVSRPVWSPAKRFLEWEFDRMAFVYATDAAGTQDLYLQQMHPGFIDQFAPRWALATSASAHEGDPAWSADGSLLALVAHPANIPPESPQLYEVMRIPGADCNAPLVPLNLSNRPLDDDGDPVWLKR